MEEMDFIIYEDSAAAQKAKSFGLKYAGFGKWKDKTGNIVAQTKDGKLKKIAGKGFKWKDQKQVAAKKAVAKKVKKAKATPKAFGSKAVAKKVAAKKVAAKKVAAKKAKKAAQKQPEKLSKVPVTSTKAFPKELSQPKFTPSAKKNRKQILNAAEAIAISAAVGSYDDATKAFELADEAYDEGWKLVAELMAAEDKSKTGKIPAFEKQLAWNFIKKYGYASTFQKNKVLSSFESTFSAIKHVRKNLEDKAAETNREMLKQEKAFRKYRVMTIAKVKQNLSAQAKKNLKSAEVAAEKTRVGQLLSHYTSEGYNQNSSGELASIVINSSKKKAILSAKDTNDYRLQRALKNCEKEKVAESDLDDDACRNLQSGPSQEELHNFRQLRKAYQQAVLETGLVDNDGYITLFRGITTPSSAPVPKKGQKFTKFNYKGSSVDSWSYDPEVTKNFGLNVVVSKVHISQIVSAPGLTQRGGFYAKSGDESEIIVDSRKLKSVEYADWDEVRNEEVLLQTLK